MSEETPAEAFCREIQLSPNAYSIIRHSHSRNGLSSAQAALKGQITLLDETTCTLVKSKEGKLGIAVYRACDRLKEENTCFTRTKERAAHSIAITHSTLLGLANALR